MAFIQMLINAISLGFTFAVLGIGLSLIFGTVEIVNFAHGEALMLSMYIAFWTYSITGLDPLYSIPLAAIILFIVGVLTHRYLIKKILKAEMVTQIFATYGLSLLLSSLAQFFWSSNFRSVNKAIVKNRIDIIDGLSIQVGNIIIIIVSIFILVALFWFIKKTETGQAILAVSEDPETASLMGIDPDKMYMLVWGISLSCIGITGALLGGLYYAYPTVGSSFGTLSFIAVAMGGFGSISGAFLGAFLVGFIQVFSAYFFEPSFKLTAVMITFIIVLIIKPRGFFGRY